LGIEPKTPGLLVQDPTTSPSGDLMPTIRGSGAHPGRGTFYKIVVYIILKFKWILNMLSLEDPFEIVHPTGVLIVPFLAPVTGTNGGLGDSQ
jgi:hypothetical protein